MAGVPKRPCSPIFNMLLLLILACHGVAKRRRVRLGLPRRNRAKAGRIGGWLRHFFAAPVGVWLDLVGALGSRSPQAAGWKPAPQWSARTPNSRSCGKTRPVCGAAILAAGMARQRPFGTRHLALLSRHSEATSDGKAKAPPRPGNPLSARLPCNDPAHFIIAPPPPRRCLRFIIHNSSFQPPS